MVELPLNWDPLDPNKLAGWITPKMQQGSLLCWAATTEMAVNYYGTVLPQCQQVNDIFWGGSPTCCPNPEVVNGCDTTNGTVPQFPLYGFHVIEDQITDWTKIKTFICKKKSPFLYFFEPYSGAREHIFLVYGYDTSEDHIFIVDPYPFTDDNGQTGPFVTGSDLPTSAMTFEEMFAVGWGPQVHTRDFVDICPLNVAATNGGSCPKFND